MKRYEITYMENGKTETIDVYGFENFETFVDENKEFIDIMHVEEFDIQGVAQEDKEEEAFNILKKEIEKMTEEGMTDVEIALILCGAVGMIRMCHEKFHCSFSEDLVKKFENLFIHYRYGR